MRRLIFGLVTLAFSQTGLAKPTLGYNQATGTSNGFITEDPEWSLGLRVGANTITGVTAQRIGFESGAINMGAGLGFGEVSLFADYIWFLNQKVKIQPVVDGTGFTSVRGLLLPYFGAGIQVGNGIYLRIPIGLQYTLLKDPVSLFGGAETAIGPFLEDDKKSRVRIGIVIGIRLLV